MFNNPSDPVDAKVAAMTAEEVVEWLTKYHGLAPDSAGTVVMNLREQFRFHRLQGRVDQRPALAVLMDIFKLRQDVQQLRTPARRP